MYVLIIIMTVIIVTNQNSEKNIEISKNYEIKPIGI